MTNRRALWVTALIGVGIAAVLVGLILHPQVPGWQRDTVDQDAAEEDPAGQDAAGKDAAGLAVPADDAVTVTADAPNTTPDPDGLLHAGDHHGGAITYLRFDVPSAEVAGSFSAAELELTAHGQLPALVELVAVPDTDWDPGQLVWQDAPLLGEVTDARHEPAESQLAFDVSDVVTGPGRYAFAVTVPPDLGQLSIVAEANQRPTLHLVDQQAIGPSPAPPVLPASPTSPASPASPAQPPRAADQSPGCTVDELLVPSCGALWGVAPAGHTGLPRTEALHQYEQDTNRHQNIYHAYHRSQSLFPTQEEVAIAAQGRILFLNWKPLDWSWAQIADGDEQVDAYLDRLAAHINATYRDPFFFTVHHEPENDVQAWPGSGWQASDYADMFSYVVQRLRGNGVDNLVTVMDYMAYVPWNTQPWFEDLYPGDDVVDWVGWNAYAYSDPGYGYGDFAEMVNRRSTQEPQWPGFYSWATRQFPDKPLMLAEWGVWHSDDNPGHMATFYESASRQVPLFPRLKALVYFDTPADQRDRDSRPTATEQGLREFQRLGQQQFFPITVSATHEGGLG